MREPVGCEDHCFVRVDLHGAVWFGCFDVDYGVVGEHELLDVMRELDVDVVALGCCAHCVDVDLVVVGH